MKKTLIIFLHGMGDCVMLTGVLKKYREMHPNDIIDLLVLDDCRWIFKENPNINEVYSFFGKNPKYWNPFVYYLGFGFLKMIFLAEKWKQVGYDEVILSEIQTMPEIFYNLTNSYNPQHKIERICDDLGVPRNKYPCDLYTSLEDKVQALKIKNHLRGSFAVIHPFSKGKKRKMGQNIINDVISNLWLKDKIYPIVVGSKEEEKSHAPIFSTRYYFGLPLGVIIELLKLTDRFIGTDSLIAHLVGFANVKDITIYSPHTTAYRYAPIANDSKITFKKL